MRSAIAALILIGWTSYSFAAGFMLLHVGPSDGGGGGGGGVVACPQTGLDFSNPCNLIYQPALIH